MSINIDYSQDGNSLFENVYITGLLDYDFSSDNLKVNSLEINNNVTVTKDLIVSGGSSISGSSTVGGSLDLTKNLFVGGQSYFTGIATFNDTVTFNESLSFPDLEVRDRLTVGVGGTVFTASSLLDPGKVGIGSTQPNQLFDVGGTGIFHKIGIGTTSPRNILDVVGISNFDGSVGIGTTIPFGVFQINDNANSLVVTDDGRIGIGTTNPTGSWTTSVGTNFNDGTQGKLGLSVDGSVRISRNIYDSNDSAGLTGMFLQRDGGGIRWTSYTPSLQEGILLLDEGIYVPTSTGVAQTFSQVNFSQVNSYGTGVDNLVPTTSLPIFNITIDDREGTIGASSNVVSISTVGISSGQIIVADVADPTSILDTNTEIIEIGVGQITLSSSNKLSVEQTINFDIGENEYSGLATVFTNDFWGVVEGHVGVDTGIYRLTNVGIGTALPVASLQVGSASSAFAVSGFGSVGIGTTNPLVGLDVHYDTHLKSTLKVDDRSTFVGLSTFNDGLIVHSGVSTFVGFATFSDVYVGGATTLTGITTTGNQLFVGSDFSVGGATTLTGITTVGDTLFTEQLSVIGVSTFNDDVTFTGSLYNVQWDNSENALHFNDNAEATFGNTSDNPDLQIYYTDGDGSNGGSVFKHSGDHDMRFQVPSGAHDIVFETTSGANLAVYNADGAVDLHWRGTSNPGKKFATTSAGIDITGHTETDTFNVSGVSTHVGISTFNEQVGIAKTLDLGSHILDVNQDTGVGVAKTDYRLASVGTGVSWRPSGVQTKNTIWVSINGDDSNTGLLEGDSKRTIGAAAAIAETGDTIIVRSGVYYENNPVGLRTEVTVSGEDLRLVTIVPNNVNKDVFQVRAGCLIQNMNFAGQTSTTNHPNCGAVAFPPTSAGIAGGLDYQAVTGYTALGPANQGPDRVDPTKGARYRSPYVRNCTNFMTGSVGMKINGDYVNAAFTGVNDLGQDLKSMVCDSFTQYNQAGIGVSLTNNAYAQLVSIFTIGCDIAIFAGSGGQCDLTNSNSSFGNFGLKADGIGDVEFTGQTDTTSIAGQDTIAIKNVKDASGNIRKPFDGQGAYFKIDLDNYPDALGSGTITEPLQFIRSIDIVDGGSGYNPGAPPNVTIPEPQGPEAILPEFSANVGTDGSITSIDVIASGRNFVADQDFTVTFSTGNAVAKVNTDPILYTVSEASEPDTVTGLTNVTFNEFIPYSLGLGVDVDFSRLSRIITSSHSFEYVGAGTDLNKANPFQGGEPIPENEIVAINGGQIPFTSTDQKGNFRIGEGLTIDQTTSTIRGRDFNRAIQAQLTPLILALR